MNAGLRIGANQNYMKRGTTVSLKQKGRVARMMSAPCFMTIEEEDSIIYAATLAPLRSQTETQFYTAKSKVLM